MKAKRKEVQVAAPDGYHWMTERGRYYLMPGEYQEHPGASEKVSFKIKAAK